MRKIKVIVLKEWAEVFKRKLVLSTIIFMPLMFSALPLIILSATRATAGEALDLTSEVPQQFLQICPQDLTGGECYQVFLVRQFMILFMLTPLIVPVNIAAYAIVGEKTTRSLEPLLATPITTVELIAGKNLASAIPAVLATWGGFVIYLIGAWLVVDSPAVIRALLDPIWWVAVFILGPLLAILSVNFAMMVSSRVNDPRVAEQVSVVVIIPIMAVFFGQVSGLFFINQNTIYISAIVLAIIDVLVLYLTVQLFQRETILTRWK